MIALTDNDYKILRYISAWQDAQTYRIANHVGYKYSDLATRHIRAMLKRLERNGFVTSQGNGSNVLFWSLTDAGKDKIR